MNEQLFCVNGIEYAAESFGNPEHSAILLIMGAQASMVWWDVDFCQRLAAKGYFVIRYDNRDNAIRVLDQFGIARAHVIGISMGGLLTQILALQHPERVLTITLLATTNFAPDLPPMEEKVIQYFTQAAEIDWTKEEVVIAFTVGKWKVLAGSKHPFEEKRINELAVEEVKRSQNIASMNNHGLVTGGESYLVRTGEIDVPTLVIHGTEDPIIPYAHGVALAQAIGKAELLTLEGTGHELHQKDWVCIIEAISKHSIKHRNTQ
ncbi:alpha/beta fold hydrolase [Brevibacillus centrosporus]|uniref:alpha/beta fold hydrolase n=1 Tax=Brevibacillus centrosporus TaxID=54910 RepID=UPI003987D0D9